MKITDALRGEHGVLYRLLDYCSEGASGWNLEAAHAAAGALEAALKSHAEVEDELLFQQLDRYFPPGVGPLAVMRSDHEQIEGGVERALRSQDLEEVRSSLERVGQVAYEHFAKEEQVLFPMAEQRLGDAELTAIGERWAERRNVVLA